MAKHTIMGGKVHVYRRENSRFWQCSTFLNGKNLRASTKEESLGSAKDFAEDWYLILRAKRAQGELVTERTLNGVSQKFLDEYAADTAGRRNKSCVTKFRKWWRKHRRLALR